MVGEDLDHGDGGFARDDAAAEREHVGVVVFARATRGIYVVREHCADAGNFVRRDGAGHVTGCDLFAGRVRNIFFTRTAK